MTKKELLALAISSEEYNTNNAWGFGGGYGTEYTFNNGLKLRDGIACYRHAPSHRYITVCTTDERIIDTEVLRPAHIEQILNLIK